MPRKSKNTSIVTRCIVIWHYEKGMSYSKIGKLVNLNKSTMADIGNRFKNEGRIESIRQPERPRKLIE